MKVVVYGTAICPLTKRTMGIMDKSEVKYEFVDLFKDVEAGKRIRSEGHRGSPVVKVFKDIELMQMWESYKPELTKNLSKLVTV